MKGYLILQDGSVFEGKSIGGSADVMCEIIFNTSMAGYLQILNDNSFYGQGVVFTYPLIGNFGVINEDMIKKPAVKAFIMREMCNRPSNFRCDENLTTYLKENDIATLEGIDTRRLTQHIRDNGNMMGYITSNENFNKEEIIAKLKAFTPVSHIADYSVSSSYNIKGEGAKIAVYDFGELSSTLEGLGKYHCDITVIPYNTPATEVISGGYQGVILSNGSGNPLKNSEIIENIKELLHNNVPTFGIGLGFLLLGVAMGGKCVKMHHGHSGTNYPVYDKSKDRAYITTQNYVYTLENSDDFIVTQYNVNDKIVEGIISKNMTAFGVSYQPNVEDNVIGTGFLYRDFVNLTKGGIN